MKSTSVICGIDLGSWSIKVSVFSGQGFQILTNEANFRQTPTLVGYTEAQRLIGEQALIKLKKNYQNTIRAPHRLLTLHRRPYLVQEQLHLSKTEFNCCEDGVQFIVKEGSKEVKITAEQVLIGLFYKAKSIVESHGLKISLAYLSVPTYWGPQERYAFIKCGQLGIGAKVRLVDDWACLGIHYAYSKLQELKKLEEMRNVVFLDVGYSKSSLYLVQYSQHQARLLDWEYLPYTGLKNMDEALLQFYNGLFQQKYKDRPLDNSKSLPKLLQAVQKQRTVLSANSEHHLMLEYLMNDEDLAYDMNRQEFEDLVVPVLSDLAASMAALQSRNCSILIHSLQIMGGGSRVPCLQSMASKIFGVQISRSLNQSQAFASGCALLAALNLKLINLPYRVDSIVVRPMVARWNNSKHQLFHPKTHLPCESVLNLGNEGVIDIIISCDQNIKGRQVALVRVKTPTKLTFYLTENKILQIKSNNIKDCQLFHRSQQSWKIIIQKQKQREKLDQRMIRLYELKNQTESIFYQCKNKYQEKQQQVKKQDLEEIESGLVQAEKWIEEEHQQFINGHIDNVTVFEKELLKIKKLKQLIVWGTTPNYSKPEKLKEMYQALSSQIEGALSRPLQEWEQEKLMETMVWGQKAYKDMEENKWQGNQLTTNSIDQAIALVKTLGLK